MKNNIPYFTLRLLTVFSYFLPFVFFLSTCTDVLNTKEAFNKNDAIENEKEENENKVRAINNFILSIDSAGVNKEMVLNELVAKINLEFHTTDNIHNLSRDWELGIYFPTNYSLSAIGVLVFHKSTFGKILIGISILGSLVSLFLWFLVVKFKLALYLLIGNITAILLFIIVCYFSDITILCGNLIVLFLLIMQLITEVYDKKKSVETNQKEINPNDHKHDKV